MGLPNTAATFVPSMLCFVSILGCELPALEEARQQIRERDQGTAVAAQQNGTGENQ